MSDLFKRTGDKDFSKFLKVMVSGPPKSGKTSLLGTVPNMLVLDTEPNANNLESIAHLNVPYVTIESTDDLRQVAMILGNDSLRTQLARDKYGIPDIGAVAIDTLDSLQKIMKIERMKEQRTSKFLRDDWGWLKTEMEEIVKAFTALPMHVFFMVHTKTKEVGQGDDAYTIVQPGLEGAISESIAGMVGYSLLSFRQEEIAADGTPYTKYWLRTEGDRTYDFLGTRTAGRLPTIIEPNMKTIYDTVMSNRPAQAAQAPAPQAAPAPAQPAESVAQSEGQVAPVQTDVQTTPAAAPAAAPEPAPAAPAAQPAQNPAPQAEGKPDDSEPVSPAALTHVKRVYDSLEVSFPEEIVRGLTMGEARLLVKYWRAIQQDHAENKSDYDSPQAEMLDTLKSHGWITEDPAPAEKAPEVEAKPEGTIEETLAWVGDDLARAQEAYDRENAKDAPRKGLINRLETIGAKPAEPAQAPVESPAPQDDTPSIEEATSLAEKPVEEGGLGATEIITEGTACDVCKNPIDDVDLAELGKKRFGKVLCVSDYLAEQKK